VTIENVSSLQVSKQDEATSPLGNEPVG